MSCFLKRNQDRCKNTDQFYEINNVVLKITPTIPTLKPVKTLILNREIGTKSRKFTGHVNVQHAYKYKSMMSMVYIIC